MTVMSFLRIDSFVLFAVTIAVAQSTPQQTSASIWLSQEQKSKLAEIKSDAEKKAAPIALQFAEVTKKVYDNMLSDSPDEQLRVRLSEEMRVDASHLLAIKGESIWVAVRLLTAEQRELLKAEMRNPGAPSDLTELIDKLFNH